MELVPQFPEDSLAPDEAWERRPTESAEHYGWFGLYRDMKPSKRSLENLRQLLHDQGKSPARETLRVLSVTDRWAERAAAWDAECDRIRRMAAAEAIEESSRKIAEAADDLMSKGLDALGNLDIARMNPQDIRQFIVDAAKLKRLALGAPTEVVESREEGRDYVSELTVLLGEEFGGAAVRNRAARATRGNHPPTEDRALASGAAQGTAGGGSQEGAEPPSG